MILIHSIPSHNKLDFLSFPVGSFHYMEPLVTGDFDGFIKNGEPVVRVLSKSCLYLSPVTSPLFIFFSSELFFLFCLLSVYHKKMYRLKSSEDQDDLPDPLPPL